MDWSEKILCIKCNGGGNLLICREDGCSLAMHEGCLSGCPARFDDAGQFYCPFCWHKRAVAESHRAREDALAKKNALLIFMGEKVVGNGEDQIVANMDMGKKNDDRSIRLDADCREDEDQDCFYSQDSSVKSHGEQRIDDKGKKEIQVEEEYETSPNSGARAKRVLKKSDQADKGSKVVLLRNTSRRNDRNKGTSESENTLRRSKRLAFQED